MTGLIKDYIRFHMGNILFLYLSKSVVIYINHTIRHNCLIKYATCPTLRVIHCSCFSDTRLVPWPLSEHRMGYKIFWYKNRFSLQLVWCTKTLTERCNFCVSLLLLVSDLVWNYLRYSVVETFAHDVWFLFEILGRSKSDVISLWLSSSTTSNTYLTHRFEFSYGIVNLSVYDNV